VSAEDEYCDVADPVDVNFYKNVWLRQASINTTVYDKVQVSSVCHSELSINMENLHADKKQR